MSNWEHAEIRAIIKLALDEDIGPGDITTETFIADGLRATVRFYARQDLVLAGVELLPIIYDMRGGVDSIELLHSSGDKVEKDEIVARVRGRARTLLECERTALN